MYLFRLAVWTLSATTLLAATVQGATRTVCASGCMYTNLQPAIDAAQPGDTILLRAGETFIGNYILRAKSGTTEIIIRSDAAASSVPASGVRLVPSGRTGGNTALSSLARLRGQGSNWRSTPSSGPRTARTTTGCSSSRLTARTRKVTRRSSRSGTTLPRPPPGSRPTRSRSTACSSTATPCAVRSGAWRSTALRRTSSTATSKTASTSRAMPRPSRGSTGPAHSGLTTTISPDRPKTSSSADRIRRPRISCRVTSPSRGIR